MGYFLIVIFISFKLTEFINLTSHFSFVLTVASTGQGSVDWSLLINRSYESLT